MVGILAGHCKVSLHLNIIGVYERVPSCRRCELHDKSVEHVIFDCFGLEPELTASFGKLARKRRLPDVGLFNGTLGSVQFLDLLR